MNTAGRPHPHRSLPSAGAVIAVAGVTGTLGLAGAASVTMQAQAREATRRIEDAAVQAAAASGAIPESVTEASSVPPPHGDGVYRSTGPADGRSAPFTLAVLGDSTAVGYGTSTPEELPGVLLARRVAATLDGPVRLSTHGRVGAESAELLDQVEAALADHPDVAVLVIGANDITAQVPPQRSAARLGAAVTALRTAGVEVVVATCPDFGVIAPIPQPLRTVVMRWSRRLAAQQERAVLAAGGVPVAIGRLVSPAFRGDPEMFFADGFHPSAAGYRRAVDALEPEVVAAALRTVAGAAPGH